MNRFSSLMVAAAVALTACQTGPASLSEADLAAIGEVRAAMVNASLTGDADAGAALYAEDAIQLPPNAPAVRGRAAIREADAALGALSTFELRPEETWGVGDFAYDRGTYSLSVQMPDTATYREVGKYLVLLRRQTDGSWKMTTAMWSSDAPPPPPPSAPTGT